MKTSVPLKPIAITVAGLFFAYALLGFLAVPAGVRNVLDTTVQKELAGTFSVQSVRFNPFTLACRIQGAEIKTDGAGPFFSVENILIDLSIASLFKLAPVISRLTIDTPKLAITLGQDEKPVLPRPLTEPGPPETSDTQESVFGFSIEQLSLLQGQVTVHDTRFEKTHEIRDLALDLPKLSTLDLDPAAPAHAAISFALNQAPVRIDLSGSFFGPGPKMTVGITGSEMDLTPWLSYVPLPEPLSLIAPGILSWDLTVGVSLENKALQNPTDQNSTDQNPTDQNPKDQKASDLQSSRPKISISGSAGLKNIAADLEGQGPLCRLPEFFVQIDSSDVLAKGVYLPLVRLEKPEVFLVRHDSGQMPLETLFNTAPETAAAENAPAVSGTTGQKKDPVSPPLVPIPIVLDRFDLKDGQVHITDLAVPGEFRTLVAPVSFQVTGLNIKDNRIQLSAESQLATPAGETLSVSGQMTMDNGVTKADGHLALENGSPSAYDAYLRPLLGPSPYLKAISADGDFSVKLDSQGIEGGVTNASLRLSGLGLKATEGKEPMVHIPEIKVAGIDVDLAKKAVRIASLDADQGKVVAAINGQGQMNLATLAQSFPVPEKQGPSSDANAPSWQIMAEKMGINGWQLDFKDQSREKKPVHVTVSDISLQLAGLNTSENAAPGRIDASMRVPESGRISFAGPVDLANRKLRLDLGIEKIDIRAFEPYVSDYVNLDIAQGTARAKTTLDLEFPPGKSPAIQITGEAGVGEFSSKDKVTGTDFFRCKSFFVSGMDISLNPIRILISDISLTDFYNRAVITESGQLNYQQILAGKTGNAARPNTPSQSDAVAPPALPEVTVQKITLQGGHINFSDLFTQPNYTANMTEVGGSVSGLSTTSSDPAEVVLKGLHGQYSPLDITGKLIPFGQNQKADMTLSFKNIDLIQFNAYSQKYLGYEIASGKLMLNLDYHIKDGQLESKNRLFFDQFDLGKKVDSQEATGLPIELALSLLKNSKDQIDLDIPVTGNLKDPKFSFGQVVGTAFKNVILGVASAPFKLLGKVIGGWGADELGYVEFDPGQDRLDIEDQKKLESLASVLIQKEKLNFIISGRYDPDLDAGALRSEKYQALLLSATGAKDADAQEAIIADPEKRARVIKKLYATAQFPKPKDEQGQEKEILSPEQEKLLLTNIEVPRQELLDLADSRSKLTMSYLVGQGLDPQRLFVQAPETAKEEDRTGQKVKTVFKIE